VDVVDFCNRLIKLFDSRCDDPNWYTEDHHRDADRHRIHAHSLRDAKLEMGTITPQQCQKSKAEWDKRHGY